MNRLLILIFVFSPLFGFSQKPGLPVEVELVLKKSGKNRPELEKAISYFKKSGDPLKVKAIYFLISNMDIHYSANYYWVDTTGNRVPFNDSAFPKWEDAIDAFNIIKSNYKGIHPVSFSYRDIDSIKATFLVDNVERAFQYWKTPRIKNLSFNDFCEYVLPYRVSVEPLQNWRKVYQARFSKIVDSARGKSVESTLHYFATDTKSWFTNTWQLEERKEPLPRLGALQLLARAKGNCEDIAGLETYVLRSQGFPAAVDHIPFWATSTGTHYFNNTIDEQLKALPFDVSTNEVKINNFSREPSKVIRETYSKQPTALASFTGLQKIPPGFMQMSNCLDVTAAHWETTNVRISVTKNTAQTDLAFVCVFSGGRWQPTWWGKIQNGTATFTDMCRGVVYLPVYYADNKLPYAGYPEAVGHTGQLTLKPDTNNKRTVTVAWQDKYLIFRPGKKYKLYCWNNGWKFSGEKTAGENTLKLEFANVPANALMLLLPEYSEGKERPFTIDDTGERQWW